MSNYCQKAQFAESLIAYECISVLIQLAEKGRKRYEIALVYSTVAMALEESITFAERPVVSSVLSTKRLDYVGIV